MTPNAKEQTERLLAFIRKSPTAFQAAENAGAILREAGFEPLEEATRWDLRAGGRYYVTRNLSSIIAFRVPEKPARQILIAATHTDSPMFKLKSNCETAVLDKYLKLDTEPYGGTIFASWMDRPLSVAGRVILKRNGVFTAETVNIDRDLLLIPHVAIHMNREINNGYTYDPAVDLVPLFGGAGEKGALKKAVAEALACEPDEIAGSDLFVYNRMPGSIWGAADEFFSAPRIDDLMCAWGTLQGFLAANMRPDSLNVWYSADNEETGSATRQGAGSVFLRDTLERVCVAIGTDLVPLMASGLTVSADNGHARHPNHPELCDPLNAPCMGEGVVIKSNADQRYTTDGLSEAIFREICEQAGVPVQFYANRSDMRGGSTLGSIAATKVPIRSVDIGMAQLAMHSSYETAGTADTAHLVSAMRRFFESTIRSENDRAVRLSFE